MCNQVQSTKSYYYANMGRKETIMEEYYSHSTMIDYGVFLNADSEEASMTKEDSRGGNIIVRMARRLTMA